VSATEWHGLPDQGCRHEPAVRETERFSGTFVSSRPPITPWPDPADSGRSSDSLTSFDWLLEPVRNQQLAFDTLENWALTASPKPSPAETTGVFAWTPSYTAFSEKFAIEAIQILNAGRTKPVLLDPFVGGGTSLVAAARLGVRAIGSDLDPFAALISRARVATCADSQRVFALLSPANDHGSRFAESAHEFFRHSDLRFASAVIDTLRETTRSTNERALFVGLLNDSSGDTDSEVVALAALCLGGDATAKVVRGSNPVWFRKAMAGEIDRRSSLAAKTRAAARKMLHDLEELRQTLPERDVRVLNEDFRHTSLRARSFDILLTSPPYLNRLDYVIKHIAPLTILTGLLPFSMESLRREMMGTTKIVEKGEVRDAWGSLCSGFMDAVQRHPSKDSATYYFWTYYRYFKDLDRTLLNLVRLARRSAKGALVIQNSFYKEIVVPTPEILVQMAASLGIRASIVRTENVRAHLGTLSPRQTRYVPRKVLKECVVLLEF
jgi:hypothetical protein